MTDHLLPPNATPLERAMSIAMARLADIGTPARVMWDPDLIPAAYLPWLAWALSVDEWDPDWTVPPGRRVRPSTASTGCPTARCAAMPPSSIGAHG